MLNDIAHTLDQAAASAASVEQIWRYLRLHNTQEKRVLYHRPCFLNQHGYLFEYQRGRLL